MPMARPATAPPPSKTVSLHPAQRDFLQCTALYKGFAAGVGSGKTWVIAYDLIRRSQPGRLYMLVSPTFGMLSDSSWKTLTTIARDLGMVQDAKQSPPSLRLRNGATIIGRSADDPEHLRGVNLSGIALDEASLMARDTFDIAIGRLREEGQQGFLTAAFTPRGKRNWTYEVFATGRADTACVHCRTGDNPFLPAQFDATIRAKYTSLQAAQELEGLFIDAEGALFKREWFGMVDAAPPIKTKVRAWDCAATALDPKKAADPDWTAGVLMGRTDAGDHLILDVRRLRGSPQQVQALIRRTAEEDGKEVAIVMEQEPGSSGKVVIDFYHRHVLSGYNFAGVRSTGDKVTRAGPLASSAEAGLVKLLRGSWNAAFLDEVESFPQGDHDDQVDAASLAFSKVQKRRVLWCRIGGETIV